MSTRKVAFRRRQERSFLGEVISAEILELRMLPAGTVTAAFTGSGENEVLTIAGDNKANEVVLAVRPTGLFLKADDAKTVIKFGDQTSSPGGELKLSDEPSLPGSLSVDMKGGNDSFEIAVGDHFGDISDETGLLPDSITPEPVSALIGADVTVLIGKGSDLFDIAVGPEATLEIGGSLFVDAGAGSDFVVAGTTAELAQTLHSNGLGEDIGGDTRLTIGGNAQMLGGKGTNLLAIASTHFKGDLSITQQNLVEIANVQVDGDFDLFGTTSADIWVLRVLTIQGSTQIDTGAGSDAVVFREASLGSQSSIQLGKGKDAFCASYTSADSDIQVDGGAGKDISDVDYSLIFSMGNFELNNNSGYWLGNEIVKILAKGFGKSHK